MDRVDDDRYAGRPRGDPTHGPGDGAVGVNEVGREAPEQARETPGRAGQGPGLEPARRIDDRDGKTLGPEELDVLAGAADDPVLDRGWPMKMAHSIDEDLLGGGGRIDHVDDTKLGCNSLVENHGCHVR